MGGRRRGDRVCGLRRPPRLGDAAAHGPHAFVAVAARARMVRALSASAGIGMTSQRTRARMVARLRTKGIADERVLAALGAVPRHLFVEEALASRASEDDPLPIRFAQTLS